MEVCKQHLTKRQNEILPLLQQGLTNKDIASDLGISVSTVTSHIHEILIKLRANNTKTRFHKL